VFKNLSIGAKLQVAFGLVSLMTLIVGTTGYVGTTKLAASLEVVTGDYLPGIIGLCTLRDGLSIALRGERSLMHNIPDSDRARLTERVKRGWESADKGLKMYESTPRTKEEDAEWESFKSALRAWQVENQKVMAQIREGKLDEAKKLSFGLGGKTFTIQETMLNKILELNVKYAEDEHVRSAKLARRVETVAAAITLAGFVLSSLLGLLIARGIRKPLAQGVEVAVRMAEGDLTMEVDAQADDETGQLMAAMKTMVEHLRDMISKTVAISEGIASASSQLQATSGQIATGAEEVAAQAATVATSSEEMSVTSADIARNCSLAADASQHSTDAAYLGAEVVQQTIAGMAAIADRARHTSKNVEALGVRSEQIGDILNTISDIADQTNLLALNAAIEAARAGEQGRGFAVVADEVRALAERTTKATSEVGAMIKNIQQETREAVEAMGQGVVEVEKGAELSQRSGRALEEIRNRIDEVSMQISQIATAAEQQTATTSEVANNVLQITGVIQQTANGADDTANAAGMLAQQANELRILVSRFKL